MKRYFIIFVLLATIVTLPVIATAQGCGSWDARGDKMCRIDFQVGYASDMGRTETSGTAQGAGVAGLTSIGIDFDPMHSLYLGAALPIDLPVGIVRIAGSLTIPASTRANFLALGPVPATREWSTSAMWTTLDGGFGLPVGGRTYALAGFRWDRFDTRSKSPTNPGGFLVALSAPTDRMDFTVNGYLPLVGLMSTYSGLTVGMWGWPAFYGDLTYHDNFSGGDPIRSTGTGTLNNGYYVEIFTEMALGRNFLSRQNVSVDGSLFARLIFAEGQGTAYVEFNDNGNITTEAFDDGFHRTMFVVGGTINFDTALPGMLDSIRVW